MAWVEIERGTTYGLVPLSYSVITFVDDGEVERTAHCWRCGRQIRPRYKVCYRCYWYLRKHERIA